jgi:phospholipid/cholesterol/gamma-HCH transport system substrate-binding protein
LDGFLRDNQQELDSAVGNIGEITANFATLSDSLSQAGLSRTVRNLENTITSLDALLQRMEQGEGTMGRLLKDDSLYENLAEASRELDLLLQDFRLNPKRYVNVSVFGKKQKEYVVPENDPADSINQN